MLSAICREINNYFIKDNSAIHLGDYSISNGIITGISSPFDFLKIGQYYRIVGSDLNDGVYLYNGEANPELKDEVFSGAIWAMSIPRDFLDLVDEITAWNSKYASDEQANSPYQSESFDGYSYSKPTGANGDTSWRTQFKSRLNAYRRLYVI